MATIDRIIPPYPADADPEDVWPGVADINARGVAIAVEMLAELERNDEVGSGVCESDLSQLEDWPRLGTPFRNVVLEHLKRARDEGAEVEEGFCAVLSDMAALNGSGMVMPGASRYVELYPAAEVPNG